jgi:phosphomannomutase
VRPSGTEPKLKLYAHARREIVHRSGLAHALDDARRFVAALLFELEEVLKI